MRARLRKGSWWSPKQKIDHAMAHGLEGQPVVLALWRKRYLRQRHGQCFRCILLYGENDARGPVGWGIFPNHPPWKGRAKELRIEAYA